jgi:2-polyprenyl-3-methyl-5-hydroxy-6-metoxy-1,4-benzoquinol methylase
MGDKAEYQYGFSERHPDQAYNVEQRKRKAAKTLAVLGDFLGSSDAMKGMDLLDLGCSTGVMTREYGRAFRKATGIDIDRPAVEYASRHNAAGNVVFFAGDTSESGFPDGAFDVVTCTHIYEHVPDSALLMKEIHRLLKPGGACFFAAGNRFMLIESHYRLPLLAAIPKPIAHIYIRLAGKADRYYEKHLSLRGLRRLVAGFGITDYTRRIVADPVRFHSTDMVRPGSLKQKLALAVMSAAYWLCPTYIWVLRKPADSRAERGA